MANPWQMAISCPISAFGRFVRSGNASPGAIMRMASGKVAGRRCVVRWVLRDWMSISGCDSRSFGGETQANVGSGQCASLAQRFHGFENLVNEIHYGDRN